MGGADVVPSSQYDGAAQVDGTGRTTINMLVNNKYISPHNYNVIYSKSKLAVEVPSCRIFSVVLGLSQPPINITPAGESQLE